MEIVPFSSTSPSDEARIKSSRSFTANFVASLKTIYYGIFGSSKADESSELEGKRSPDDSPKPGKRMKIVHFSPSEEINSEISDSRKIMPMEELNCLRDDKSLIADKSFVDIIKAPEPVFLREVFDLTGRYRVPQLPLNKMSVLNGLCENELDICTKRTSSDDSNFQDDRFDDSNSCSEGTANGITHLSSSEEISCEASDNGLIMSTHELNTLKDDKFRVSSDPMSIISADKSFVDIINRSQNSSVTHVSDMSGRSDFPKCENKISILNELSENELDVCAKRTSSDDSNFQDDRSDISNCSFKTAASGRELCSESDNFNHSSKSFELNSSYLKHVDDTPWLVAKHWDPTNTETDQVSAGISNEQILEERFNYILNHNSLNLDNNSMCRLNSSDETTSKLVTSNNGPDLQQEEKVLKKIYRHTHCDISPDLDTNSISRLNFNDDTTSELEASNNRVDMEVEKKILEGSYGHVPGDNALCSDINSVCCLNFSNEATYETKHTNGKVNVTMERNVFEESCKQIPSGNSLYLVSNDIERLNFSDEIISEMEISNSESDLQQEEKVLAESYKHTHRDSSSDSERQRFDPFNFSDDDINKTQLSYESHDLTETNAEKLIVETLLNTPKSMVLVNPSVEHNSQSSERSVVKQEVTNCYELGPSSELNTTCFSNDKKDMNSANKKSDVSGQIEKRHRKSGSSPSKNDSEMRQVMNQIFGTESEIMQPLILQRPARITKTKALLLMKEILPKKQFKRKRERSESMKKLTF